MGDHLDGLAQVFAAALALDDLEVDLTGRCVIGLRHVYIKKPLVVAQIEIGLGSIIRDVHFTMLIRIHRTRIDIDVRIEFQDRDRKATLLQEQSDGG